MLKELFVNISFVESLKKMHGYVKFMKDLVIKNQMVIFEPANNMNHYSAIAAQSLVEKKKDHKAFTIPFTIASLNFA